MSFSLNNKIIATIILLTAITLGVFALGSTKMDGSTMIDAITTPLDVPNGLEVATFGTGCFWCMEAAFQQTPGIVEAISGYGGGQESDPTYEEVYTMQTSHRESVQVFYDSSVISFNEILDVFWRGIDPTDDGGQFVDRGFSYTAAVFYHTDEQKTLAEQSINELAQSGRFESPIVTPVVEFTTFYPAEEYHQDFYLKSPSRYGQYASNSGRDEYREFVWQEIQKKEAL